MNAIANTPATIHEFLDWCKLQADKTFADATSHMAFEEWEIYDAWRLALADNTDNSLLQLMTPKTCIYIYNRLIDLYGEDFVNDINRTFADF